MATIHHTPAPTTTKTTTKVPPVVTIAPEQGKPTGGHKKALLAGLVTGILLIAAILAAGITALVIGSQDAATPAAPAVAADMWAYQPGGSVYDSQVPAEANLQAGSLYDSQVPAQAGQPAVPDLAAYQPGGSVYDSQVPAQAGQPAVPDLSAYQPGGSVYDSQVPAEASLPAPDLAPYQPGGSVYDSQVPKQASEPAS
jgi:hypothetical protein